MIVGIDFGATSCRVAVPGQHLEPGFVTLPWCVDASFMRHDLGRASTPSEALATRVLTLVKALVEARLREPIAGAVLTVPAGADRRSKARSRQRAGPGDRVDHVHFSVTAPPSAPPAAMFVINIWAHLESQREAVVARAREAAAGAPIMVQTKGPTVIARGTVLSVRLSLEDLVVDPCEDTLLWDGEVGNATFPVRVPKEARPGPRPGVVTVYANGLRIARIDFVLQVAAQAAAVEPLEVRETRYQTAFACCASEDREEVAARIQGIQKGAPGIDIFWDRHSLRSGQQWESAIAREIRARDVFYLFWSRAASRSEWVNKEWRCALDTRGIGYIDPVPLAAPEDVPPPPELGGTLHFNDWVLAYTRQAPQPRPRRWWKWLR